ncbi:phospholipase A1 2-like [Eupeodes corollae]|uniref:phospholipase A1 2-like n=1 Tax=Eupeodes corollae TaxID=290404 RepID=UPI0024932DB9|nr:phospholipase A1 2-like [Eupeodes corollae]
MTEDTFLVGNADDVTAVITPRGTESAQKKPSRPRNGIEIHALPANFDGKQLQLSPKDDPLDWMKSKGLSSAEPDRIHFYLYTRSNLNEPVEIDINDKETLVKSPFDFRHPTQIAIHGWKDSYLAGVAIGIKNALFESDPTINLNFISVDWKVYSNFENYTISKELCSTAGKEVAQFIDWLHDNAKLRFDTLTLYGSSMGAHVSGFAGKNVQRGKIHSIIALDPALPEFEYNDPTSRLAHTDAEYVESIQTNGGGWGFYQPIGHTTFYPNGGKNQPGCEDRGDMCSHIRAVFYFTEALSSPKGNQFHSVKCDSLEQVEEGKCDRYETIIKMGDPRNSQKTKGIYYLETNSASPYARGDGIYLNKMKEIKNLSQS